jgi:agmatine/peptidylarginine deiminase
MYDILSDKMEVVEIQLPEYDELSWAYINSVQTDDIIIVPGLGNQKNDATVMEQYETLFPYYKGKIYLVQMREYVKEWGAALNCSTWTIKQK